MAWYYVTVICANCGQEYGVASALQVPGGPSKAGTVADLWPSGDPAGDRAGQGGAVDVGG